MGLQQSKEELLYQSALNGNIEAVKSLCSEGAGLEWIDKEGKTPLIVACMDRERFILAKTLIDLGANVNAYRPGLHAGTPLHHAAKRGLDHTVRLLLSRGAIPLARNDDCQTPLDVARSRGFVNVVRAIESHLYFFSGWLREFYGPGFLEAFAPQLLSRKIWAVIIPCGSYNPLKPLKLELAIYSSLQDAQPRTIVALWNTDIEEVKFNQLDATLIMFNKSTKTRYKFASGSGFDKLQIQSLYNACRGIPQVFSPAVPHDGQPSAPITEGQTAAEAAELAMAITASIQSAMEGRLPFRPNDVNGWLGATTNVSQNGWGVSESAPTKNPIQATYSLTRHEIHGLGVPESIPSSSQHNVPPVQTENPIPVLASSSPSAPPVPVEDLYDGPIHYPSIDFSPVDFSVACVEQEGSKTSESKDGDGDGSSSCVICWEAPVEAACVPCGHMSGCMSCLDEIKSKKGDCPVCRAKINQVIRIYAV